MAHLFLLKNLGGWNSLLPFSKGEKPIEGSRWAKMVKDEAEVCSRVQAAQSACIRHCSPVPSVSCLKVIKHLTCPWVSFVYVARVPIY